MFEDWFGEVGTLEITAAEPGDWLEVRFERPVDNPVVVAAPVGAMGAAPVKLALRDVSETGFELSLEALAGGPVPDGIGRVDWIAVSEGRHATADGRAIEAGVTTLASPGALRFEPVAFRGGFVAAPVVLGQIQGETAEPATIRLDAVGADGFEAALQGAEASAAPLAGRFGWIALEAGQGTASAAVTDAGRAIPLPAEGGAMLAQMQTARGPDPAVVETVEAGPASVALRIAEETSADPETRHAAERVALAVLAPGPLAGPAPAVPHSPDAPVERWSDPATWDGHPPHAGTVAHIPPGRTVLLDTDATLAGLLVEGTLVVEDARDLALATDWMLVLGHGAFVVGSEAAPFRHDFALTLTGDDPGFDLVLDGHGHHGSGGVVVEDNTAFLMAMGEGARISIHGADAAKTAWTRLAETAPVGAREIRLAEPAGWEPGDLIAIASTDFDPREAETARILAISPDGRTLTLDRALAHAHFGALQSYGNGTREWVLDTRAEVGLLSRNVTIAGEAGSVEDGLGGHIMAMGGAELRLSGIELLRMGQAGIPGRYPVHWHMLGDAEGQFIADSSIHQSFNRAVTIHGTQFVRIENTVAYDVVGHAYFLEDGSEFGNRFEGNLGMLTRAPESAEAAVLPTDLTHVSTFWITNPDNVFLGNVAAGSDHAGFWFAAGDGVTGLSAGIDALAGIVPRNAPLGLFEGNAAHSNPFANLAFDGHADPDTLAFVESEYRPERTPVIRDFTSSKSADRAIWVRATAMDLHDVKSADNARATFFSYNQTLVDSLIVGRSANTGTPQTPAEIAAGRTLPEPYNGRYFRGHSIYDGPSGVIDTHFAGFTAEDAAFQTQGAAQKSPAHFVSGLSFEAVAGRGRVDFAPESGRAHMWSSGLLDLDGSLTGRAGAALTPLIETDEGPSRFNAPPDAGLRPAWSAWQTQAPLGLLRADTSAAPGEADTVLWSRSDGAAIRDPGTFHSYHQTSVVLDSDLTYRLQYHDIPSEIALSLRFAGAGEAVVVELPNLPSDAAVSGAVAVADRAALLAASGSAYLREGTLLMLRLVADGEEADPRFVANTALEGPSARRFVAGATISTGSGGPPALADFEGPEPRLATAARSVAIDGPAPGLPDGADSFLFWDVTADGDGQAGSGDLVLDVGRQDWTGFDALDIRAATEPLGGAEGTGWRLFLRDAEQGLTFLGRHDGAARVDLSQVPEARRDAVEALVLRVHEEDFGTDPAREGAGQRTILYGIGLEGAPAARPVHLPQVIRSGEVFGILGAAIAGAQPAAAGALAVVAVAAAEGGRARVGDMGQVGNVFFETDADFRGIARFVAVLADAEGRRWEVPVSFEVA